MAKEQQKKKNLKHLNLKRFFHRNSLPSEDQKKKGLYLKSLQIYLKKKGLYQCPDSVLDQYYKEKKFS